MSYEKNRRNIIQDTKLHSPAVCIPDGAIYVPDIIELSGGHSNNFCGRIYQDMGSELCGQ